MQYFIGSSGTAESFVTVEPLYNELSRDWKNMFDKVWQYPGYFRIQ